MLLFAAAALPGVAWAQGPVDAPAEAVPPPYRVVPRITVQETFTDNVNLASSGQRADQITEISPGIRITRDVGAVRGYFDYALRAVAYAQNGHPSNYLNALSTAVEVEAVDQWLFVDFSGHIAQQSISGFGPLSGLNTYANPNTAEFSSYRLSPFVQGSLGGVANYQARLTRTLSQSNSALAPTIGQTQGSVSLSGATGLARLGWVAEASRHSVDYSSGRSTEADQAHVGLSFAFTPQITGTASAGREFSNYSSTAKQSFATRDASLSWRPAPQAQATVSWGQRSFGDIHALDLSYTSPLLQVSFSHLRDVSAVPGQVLPILVRPVFGPSVLATFVTTAVAVQNRSDLSVSLVGRRDTVTLALGQSDVSRLDTLLDGRFTLPETGQQQTGLYLNWQHRLTPRYDLGLQAALQRVGALQGREDNLLRTLALSLRGKLWRQGQGSIGLRHARATGGSSYQETALTLGLTVEF